MSMVQTQDPVTLSISEVAAAKVRELIEDEGNQGLKLRVFVTGGVRPMTRTCRGLASIEPAPEALKGHRLS